MGSRALKQIRFFYINKIKILILAILFGYVGVLFASTDKVGTMAMDFIKLESSVKGEALGNAITAGSEIDAISLNPASIARIKKIEFNFQYLYYYQDISYKSLRLAMPTAFGSLGLSAGLIDLGVQQRTTFLDREGSSGDTFSNNGYQIINKSNLLILPKLALEKVLIALSMFLNF